MVGKKAISILIPGYVGSANDPPNATGLNTSKTHNASEIIVYESSDPNIAVI